MADKDKASEPTPENPAEPTALEELGISEPLPYRGESWESMTQGANAVHQVQGSDFTKGDIMIGVPFILTEITLRRGDYTHATCGKPHPYMYMTAVVGPEREIARGVARGRITEDQATLLDPLEVVGWNEAGTGVYRQVIHYLESQGYVKLPEGAPDGKFGESRFDSHPDDWDFVKGDLRFGQDGEPIYTANLRLHFPRGLRVSEYENEYTKQGVTRYAA